MVIPVFITLNNGGNCLLCWLYMCVQDLSKRCRFIRIKTMGRVGDLEHLSHVRAPRRHILDPLWLLIPWLRATKPDNWHLGYGMFSTSRLSCTTDVALAWSPYHHFSTIKWVRYDLVSALTVLDIQHAYNAISLNNSRPQLKWLFTDWTVRAFRALTLLAGR